METFGWNRYDKKTKQTVLQSSLMTHGWTQLDSFNSKNIYTVYIYIYINIFLAYSYSLTFINSMSLCNMYVHHKSEIYKIENQCKKRKED